jgi:hypothetical protein
MATSMIQRNGKIQNDENAEQNSNASPFESRRSSFPYFYGCRGVLVRFIPDFEKLGSKEPEAMKFKYLISDFKFQIFQI